MHRRDVLIGGGVLGASLLAGGGIAYRESVSLDDYQATVARTRAELRRDPSAADLIRYATLAANGHNAQPWRFRVTSEDIAVLPDFSRRTSVVDPDDHHLFVSLGCATENLSIAAASRGRSGSASFNPENRSVLVSTTAGRSENGDLVAAIPKRQSTRTEYDGQPLTTAQLASLHTAASVPGVETVFVLERRQLAQIRDLVVAGNSAQMADLAFVRELRKWLRFSPKRALEFADGLFSACSGNPVAPERLGKLMFDLLFHASSENDRYARHMKSSSGVVVFVADRADPEHWIRAGRACQRFALTATSMGLQCAFMNQPVEVAGLRPELAALLGFAGQRPDLVLRFGRGPTLPYSARRPVVAVLA